MNAVKLFRNALSRHPLLTNMVSVGVLCGSGDAIAQIFVLAPVVGGWLKVLEKVKIRTALNVTPILRVAMDQILFAPVSLVAFLTLLRLGEGLSLSAANAQTSKDFKPLYSANLKVWPAIQLVNFYLVPLHYRLLFIQIVALFWNSFLAYYTRRNEVNTVHLREHEK